MARVSKHRKTYEIHTFAYLFPHGERQYLHGVFESVPEKVSLERVTLLGSFWKAFFRTRDTTHRPQIRFFVEGGLSFG